MANAHTNASRKYNEANYARLYVWIPKEQKAVVEAWAKDHGESVNNLVNRLLRQECGIKSPESSETR